MSRFQEPISDEQLEQYFDGFYSGEELEQFEARLANDPRAQQLVEIQHEFDTKLRNFFAPPDRTVEQIETWMSVPTRVPAVSTISWRLMLLAATAVAAAIAWLVVGSQWNGGRRIEPFFEQRSLVVIYEETVDRGFRPYYFCEDEERFALTFLKRQETPLALAETPKDRRMVGLSYLGGLSRDTTAMLCYVKDQPLIVFVDRKQFDNAEIAADTGDTGLRVHRRELENLVLYEVSSFDTPQMAEFLKIDR